MDNDTKTCSQCGQKDRCSQLYEEMGKSKGPSVVWKVLLAFLAPILVFILSLAGADRALQGQFEGKTLILVSFLAAVVVTLIVVVLIRAIYTHLNKTL